jgi:hypothetical protein
MDACKRDLAEAPLSDTELETERKHGIRLIRSCIKPGDEFWYTWPSRQTIGSAGVVVETGPVTGR